VNNPGQQHNYYALQVPQLMALLLFTASSCLWEGIKKFHGVVFDERLDFVWSSGSQPFWSRDPIRKYYRNAWRRPLPSTAKVFK